MRRSRKHTSRSVHARQDDTLVPPQCGDALNALAQSWRATLKPTDPKELALAFRRAMQAQPGLVGAEVPSSWVREQLPDFAGALGAPRPPAFKDFARELKGSMPKRRPEIWRNGKRVETYTVYRVPEPEHLAGMAGAAASEPNGMAGPYVTDAAGVTIFSVAAKFPPIASKLISAQNATQVLHEARRHLPDATVEDVEEALVQISDALRERTGGVSIEEIFAGAVDAVRRSAPAVFWGQHAYTAAAYRA
jgi:hypothetical protein